MEDRRASRVIAGANPIGGYSYGTANVSRFMPEYSNTERTADFILHCEEEVITTRQSHYSEKLRDS